jgi:hypothetical protein
MTTLFRNVVSIVKNNKMVEKAYSTIINGKKRRRHHPYKSGDGNDNDNSNRLHIHKNNKHIGNNEKIEIVNKNEVQTTINTLLEDIEKKNYRKETIPKRIRELVWTTYNGEVFNRKCHVSWCDNVVNVFNFQVGHDVPESKGGTLEIGNLKPICGNCNQSMGNKYTIREWNELVVS